MRKLVSMVVILVLCTLSLLFPTQDITANVTVVRFDPATVILGPDYCVGAILTLTARIDSVEDLYGIELMIEWNTTHLDYVAHETKTPVEIHAEGVLHEPIFLVSEVVNSTTGHYFLAVTSLAPAPSFYGSGIIFEIDFAVKNQPLRPETNVVSPVLFTGCYLVSTAGPIYHSVQNCIITISSFHPADFNSDMKVDIFDVVLIAREFGKFENAPDWNPIFDLAEPYGAINIFDVVVVATSYGEEYIPQN